MWRTFDAMSLATPEAFSENPGLVWQFYSYRRHMALNAKPNRAHYALAKLAKMNKNFITLSQNVDGALQPFGLVYRETTDSMQDYRPAQTTQLNSYISFTVHYSTFDVPAFTVITLRRTTLRIP